QAPTNQHSLHDALPISPIFPAKRARNWRISFDRTANAPFWRPPPITLKPTTGPAPLTAAREPRFMEPQSARLRPDSAAIFDTSRPIATEPDAKAKILLARVYRHRPAGGARSEEHTSELQSLRHLVC